MSQNVSTVKKDETDSLEENVATVRKDETNNVEENVSTVRTSETNSLEDVAQVETENVGKKEEIRAKVIQTGEIHRVKTPTPGQDLVFNLAVESRNTVSIWLMAQKKHVPLRIVLPLHKQSLSLSSQIGGDWMEKERHHLPTKLGKQIEVSVRCARKSFHIFLNGGKVGHYRYHLPLSSVSSVLVEGPVEINSIKLRPSQANPQRIRSFGSSLDEEETCAWTPGKKGCANDRSSRGRGRRGRYA